MDDPETWRWIWLVAAVVLGVGEMATTGFFLLPFALGALTAGILAFVGVGIAVQFVAFAVVSVAVFAALRPLARRLDRSVPDHGVGARRLVGAEAVVVAEIPAGDVGMVRIGGEEWRAESLTGLPIGERTTVVVREIRGTRAVVEPATPNPPNP
jgi:membrane protein implicated in regulation of membrane protease activity